MPCLHLKQIDDIIHAYITMCHNYLLLNCVDKVQRAADIYTQIG